MFKIKDKTKDIMTVSDLIDQLKDCRPDAEVFISYFSGGTSFDKCRKLINHGNHVELVRQL